VSFALAQEVSFKAKNGKRDENKEKIFVFYFSHFLDSFRKTLLLKTLRTDIAAQKGEQRNN
jgi:hypothetical protein